MQYTPMLAKGNMNNANNQCLRLAAGVVELSDPHWSRSEGHMLSKHCQYAKVYWQRVSDCADIAFHTYRLSV